MNKGLRILKIIVWTYFILGLVSTTIVVYTGSYQGEQIKGILIVFLSFLIISSLIFYYFIKLILKLRKSD